MDKTDINELIKQLIDQPLPPWEQEYLDYHAARFADTLDLLGPGEGKQLLDVGAFPGHLTLAIQTLGYQVQGLTGTNESFRSLDIFTARLSRHQIPVARADVEFDTFPFPDQYFDVVLAAEIIEHLPFNPYHLLCEAFRVLKPEGRIIISTPNLPKLDNLMNFVRGRSIHPDIRLPFHKTFKSILIGRHIREYTARELIYLLEEQNKEMYRFEGTKVCYSLCLDPAFSPRGAVLWLIKRLWPRFRATLFIQANRPKQVHLIRPGEISAQGFYEIENHEAHMGSTGRILPTPFRWSKDRAELCLPAGPSTYQVFFLHLVFLAPRYLPPAVLYLRIGEYTLGGVSISPGREYALLCLALPAFLADEAQFKLSWTCSTWKPSEHTQGLDYYEFSTTDPRTLGLAVAWDGFLREDGKDWNELLKVAERECRHRSLHKGNEANWQFFSGLYLAKNKLKGELTLGPGDWRQLGPGWHQLERWEQGWIRWSSRQSEAYLEPGSRVTRLRIKVYTGDKGLGNRVTGSVDIDWAEDRLVFSPLMSQPFSLSTDIWTDLIADLPHSLARGGVLRTTIRVDDIRIPVHLLQNSKDSRQLGMAVSSLTLK